MGRSGFHHIGKSVTAIVCAGGLIALCVAAFPVSQSPEDFVLASAKLAREAGSESNAAMLDDGIVTTVERDLAASRLQACYRANDVVLGEPTLSPVDNMTLEWPIPENLSMVSDNVLENLSKCSDQWGAVAGAYGATHQPRMDDALLRLSAACMAKNGYTIKVDASSARDFMTEGNSKEALEQRARAEECITASAEELYPSLPAVTIQY